ncbi:Cardiolipin synthetase [Roseibacterium elongatum DSM 19469]|uniref:Cardiolipin synthase n=1 Tax=Roseicyclus elongatus DSM 19469 TaxID=1294273 RepID=W8RSE7_9RHOB|nr:cardiolipin synthase [Roseibacterium elongatum]AHM04023.1 Cardiolipin synthetase [Roseibacterium elongatum DSM 19469]
MLPLLIAVVSTLGLALAVMLSWRAAQSARTPQGAVGWVVFLLSAPYIGIFVYAIFGPHRYMRKSRLRRASRDLFDDKRPDPARADAVAVGGFDRRPFERIANLPFVAGNSVDLLIDGQAAFDAMFAAIDRAETDLLVQFYTFRDDRIGTEMIDRLIAAAERGVGVRLYTDAVGSSGLSRAAIRRMEAAGIEGVAGRRRTPLVRRLQINFRNHRKTLIVDGREAFIGGLNVGDEYLGRDPEIGAWRDTFCRITGPMVLQLQVVFAEDWHWLTGQSLRNEIGWSRPQETGTVEGLTVATGPTEDEDGASAMYFAAISAARQRVWISSPYCVPDLALLSALKLAAARGCDVRLLLPERIDHHLPWLAAFAYFDELTAAGVGIWRYQAGFVHQKVFLVDDGLCGIGSTNFDNRSFRLNFETMGVFLDHPLAEQVEDMLSADFANATRLTKTLGEQPLTIRLGAPLARLVAPVL